jgi:hypothetical protein
VSRYERARFDYFARISHRIYAAHRAGDLSTPAFLALVLIIGEIDRDRRADSLEFTLRAFMDNCHWPWGRELLRVALHALKAGGWIDFDEPKQGSPKPWRIRLSGAAIDGHVDDDRGFSDPTSTGLPTDLPETSHFDGGVSGRSTFNGERSEEPGSPLAERASASNRPPSLQVAASADETRRATRTTRLRSLFSWRRPRKRAVAARARTRRRAGCTPDRGADQPGAGIPSEPRRRRLPARR